MTRNPRRLALVSGLALLLLTGCGAGNVRAGAAAIVGTERITTEALQALVDRGLADPQAAQQLGADRSGYQRQALSRLINTEILEQAAQDEGVTVSAGDVAEQVDRFAEQAGGRESLEQQAAQSGISPRDLEGFVRTIVLDQTLGDELTEDLEVPVADLRALYQENLAQYDRVRARHILVPDRATADRILADVKKNPEAFPELAAKFSTDTSNKDKGGDLGLAGRGQFVPEFEQAIFSAKPGDVVVVSTQFGVHVVEVLERQTTSLAEATPELRRNALQQARQERVQRLLQETSTRLGVKVNPRFGRWNPETGQVEPAEDPNGVLTPAPGEGGPGGDPVAPGGEPPTGEQPPAGQAPAEEPVPSPAS